MAPLSTRISLRLALALGTAAALAGCGGGARSELGIGDSELQTRDALRADVPDAGAPPVRDALPVDGGRAHDGETPADAARDVEPDIASSGRDVRRRDVPPPPPTCFDDEIPASAPELAIVSRCSAGGDDELTIYDLQDPSCPNHPASMPTGPPGVSVTLDDVVVTAVFGDTVYVQDAAGGAYSGIALFFGDLSTDALAVGDRLRVEGGAYEFYDLTEVWVRSDEALGSGAAPAPLRVEHPAHVATGGPLAEALEGVLIELSDLCVHNITLDCPADFGEYLVTGDLRVDDDGETSYEPCVGDALARLTGVLTYTFGNSKVIPRDDEDWEITARGAGTCDRKCDCIVAPGAPETGELVISEIMFDPRGADEAAEYIEVHNPNPYIVDLRRWSLADCTGQWHDIESDEAVRVPALGYAVLGRSADPWVNGGVPVDYAYGEAFYLPNSLGTVILFDDTRDLVDQVAYESFPPWPAETGRALELCDPAADNHLPESWAAATSTYGEGAGRGTPGYANDSEDCPD